MNNIVVGNIFRCRSPIGHRIYWATQLTLGVLLGVHALVYFIAPFESLYPMRAVWLMLLGFWFIFALSSGAMLWCFPAPKQADKAACWLAYATTRSIRILMAISIIGLAFHIYAKYSLTAYRHVSCPFEIRFAWMEVSHALQPWYIRVASVLGHLLSSFSYFGVFLCSAMAVQPHADNIRRSRSFGYLVIFLFIGTLYAGFIASRNVMFAYMIMALAGVLLSLCTHPAISKRSLGVGIATCLLSLSFMTGFSALVFSDRIFCKSAANQSPAPAPRADALSRPVKAKPPVVVQLNASQETAAFYLMDNCKGFSISCYEGYGHSKIEKLILKCAICAPMMLYFEHGIINFSQIAANEGRGSPLLFGFVKLFRDRLGLQASGPQMPHISVAGDGGTTLAGAAYHDYGYPGIVWLAIIFGLIYGAAIRALMRNDCWSLLGCWLFLSCFYVLFISNIFVGMNVISFPFLLFGSAVPLIFMAARGQHAP